jgi:signal transduction histidine kinase
MVSVGPVSQLRAQLGTRTERLLSAARLAGLGALLWATAHQPPPNGVTANHPVKWVLMVGSAIGWIGWMASRRLRAPGQTTWCFLALLAASGGALAAFAPIAITFMAVAGLGAGIAFEGLRALAVGAIGVGGLVVATATVGAPAVLVAEGAVSVVIGLMVGASRRQYVERAFQAEELLAERVRADAERDRAAALAERNRIGREVHDVLAHSLGALSVQLDAADALLENGDDGARARQLVQGARRLAVQGLEDTRQAVHALRDEPVALAEQLSSLAARDGVELTVAGAPRPLTADAGLALYRAAQEAVTNARKHAPGAPVSIRLDFDPHSTTLRVTNGLCPGTEATSELQTTGGGFGLQGMRERIELLGGQVVAEPSPVGWIVQVAVPV